MGFDGTPGSDDIQFIPVKIPAFKGVPVVQIACGNDHVLVLTTEGSVYTHGNGEEGQLGRSVLNVAT